MMPDLNNRPPGDGEPDAGDVDPWAHLDSLVEVVTSLDKDDTAGRHAAFQALTRQIRWGMLVDAEIEEAGAWEFWLASCQLPKLHKEGLTKRFRELLKQQRAARKEQARIWASAQTEQAPATGDDDPDAERPEPAVLALLQRTQPRGDEPPKIKSNDYNLGTILRQDSRWKDRIRLNLFWDGPEIEVNGHWRGMEDRDLYNICRWLAGTYRLDYKPLTVMEQVDCCAGEHPVHPVREYLKGLKWDGVDRVNVVLSRYFGVEATDLAGRVGTAWLISLIARVAEPGTGCNRSGGPGCKVDTMPIFTGNQGRFKSTTLEAMVPNIAWFDRTELDIHKTPNVYESMRGNWIREVAEFDSLKKVEIAKLKAFITNAIDKYRRSYGRLFVSQPRQNVFVGTINPREFLDDPTGLRRWWPFEVVADCRPDLMAAERDQLWAQAFELYMSGEQWWFGAELAAQLQAHAEQFSRVDTWTARIVDYLDGRFPHDNTAAKRDAVTVNEILENALVIPVKDQRNDEANRVRGVLTALKWELTCTRLNRATNTGPRLWTRPRASADSSVKS